MVLVCVAAERSMTSTTALVDVSRIWIRPAVPTLGGTVKVIFRGASMGIFVDAFAGKRTVTSSPGSATGGLGAALVTDPPVVGPSTEQHPASRAWTVVKPK